MRKYWIIIFVLFHFISVNGQMDIVPPSPQASSISKFVENEVSLSTGTVNVNVPIYEVALDDVTLNINLAYNTKGVLVAENASDVGVGWTLNAGGVITRQVRGRPDEKYMGYMTFNFVEELQNNSTLRQTIGNLNQTGNNPVYLDFIPDMYHVTFLGRTIKFIFDNKTKKTVTQPKSDLNVEVNFNHGTYEINGFKITDERGTQYLFTTYSDMLFKRSSLSDSNDETIPEDQNIKTSWYLQSITTTKGKIITFDYDLTNIFTFSKVDVKSPVLDSKLYRSTIKQYSVKSITHPQGKILFEKSAQDRLDLNGSKKIDNIKILDNKFQLVKKIQLNHAYSTSNTQGIDPLLLSLDPQSSKRLFLNSVEIKNKNDIKVSSYSFEYDSKVLPNIHSTSIDYWGYYNGFSNPKNLLATTGVRRETVLQYARAGSLKKITYPTGGYTEFEYDLNYAKLPDFAGTHYLRDFYKDSNIFNQNTLGLMKNNNYFKTYNNDTNPSAQGYYEVPFEVKGEAGQKIGVSLSALLGSNCTPDLNTLGCNTQIRIYRAGNNQIISSITEVSQTINLDPGSYYIRVSNPAFTYHDAFIDPFGFENNPFQIILKWSDVKMDLPYGFIGGGLRIKSIVNNDGNTSIKKSYDYTGINGKTTGFLLGLPNTYSYRSGSFAQSQNLISSLTTQPDYSLSSYDNQGVVAYQQVSEFISENSAAKGTTIYTFTAFRDQAEHYKFPYFYAIDFGYLRGLPLKIEYKDGNNNTLKIVEHEYRFNNSNHPFVCFDDNHANTPETCGAQNDILTYYLGSNFNLTNHYIDSHEISSIPIYNFSIYWIVDPITSNLDIIFDNPSTHYYRVSFFISVFFRKISTITKNYLNGKLISETTKFHHKNADHYQAVSQQDIFSDNTQSLSLFSYAHEKNNQYLIGKNMVAIPLETTVIKKKDSLDTGKVISQILTKYPGTQSEANTKTAGLPLPYEVWSKDLQNNTTLHKELSYDLYDDKGNIQQYTSKDIPVTIIWGYNDTQPIAKIEGALYDQIKTNAFITAIITASNTDASEGTFNSEQALITALDNLRKSANFSGYQITTYTYDPLVGVRSITPPSGIREVYLYDAANRLKEIREESDTGKLLKEYQYNYKQ